MRPDPPMCNGAASLSLWLLKGNMNRDIYEIPALAFMIVDTSRADRKGVR